jgi:tetratricopeptide (TPR) repeat protein
LADIFAIQEGISQEISENLRLRLTGEEKRRMTKRYTENAEAYQLYLKGRYHWNKRTGEGLNKGIQYFQQAIEKDPRYALAYTGLADCYNLLSLYSALPPKEAMPKAKAAAQQALEIDESLAEAHNSLAYARLYYDWDWNGAEREFQRALELNPNYAIAHHWYHEYLAAMGRFEESQAQILRAQELDPLSLMISADVGWGLYFARRYDEALEQLRKTLELEANFIMAHFILGLTYLQKGRLVQSAAELQKAIALSGDNPLTLALGVQGYVSAVSGRKDGAHRILKKLKTLSRQRYVSSYSLAIVYTGLGEKDAAFASLRGAYEERHDRLIYLNVEPIFDSIRSDPRFRDLLRPIGLERKSSKAAGKY